MGDESVKVADRLGKWVVSITEAGERREREFDFEDHARSWAAGQTTRQQQNNDWSIEENSDKAEIERDIVR